jgi:uncharacterized protein YdaU (DUF1376 family)
MSTTNARPWFKCYVNEEIADTRLLSVEARGAYFFLMLTYFSSEYGLPTDEKELRQITGVAARKWPAVRDELQRRLFTADWRHPRWDRQIEVEERLRRSRANAA